MQDALSHPLRRELLRVLGDSAVPMTRGELCVAVPGTEVLSQVAYHVDVLQRAGAARQVDFRTEDIERGGRRVGHRQVRLFTSAVATDKRVAALLEATRGSDRGDG